MKNPSFFYFFSIVAFLFLLSGCGNNQKLTGTVRYPDGSPVVSGTILFSSGTFLARSFIRPDGSFDVGSLKAGDGIPPGKYKVYITGAIVGKTDPKNPNREIMIPLIDSKYSSRETTPLEIEIPGRKTFDIVVERPAE